MHLPSDNRFIVNIDNHIGKEKDTFHLCRTPGYVPTPRNRRKEIARKEKIYFYDTGIRNAILGSFQKLELRNDAGPLFENFMIIERQKYLESRGQNPNRWFWRTHDQKEIDYLEETEGFFHAFEFKWTKGKIRTSIQKHFLESYPGTNL